jgi:hypothetical protein
MSLPLLIRQIFADLIINGPHQNFRFRSEASGVFHLKNEFEMTDLIPSKMDFKIGDVNHNAFTFRYIGNKDFTKNELGLYVVKNSVLDTTPVFVINQETKEFTFIGKAYFTKDDGTKALIGSGGSSGGVTQAQLDSVLQQAKDFTQSNTTYDYNSVADSTGVNIHHKIGTGNILNLLVSGVMNQQGYVRKARFICNVSTKEWSFTIDSIDTTPSGNTTILSGTKDYLSLSLKQIKTLAAGTDPQDAIIKFQLDSAITDTKSYADTKDTEVLNQAKAYIDSKGIAPSNGVTAIDYRNSQTTANTGYFRFTKTHYQNIEIDFFDPAWPSTHPSGGDDPAVGDGFHNVIGVDSNRGLYINARDGSGTKKWLYIPYARGNMQFFNDAFEFNNNTASSVTHWFALKNNNSWGVSYNYNSSTDYYVQYWLGSTNFLKFGFFAGTDGAFSDLTAKPYMQCPRIIINDSTYVPTMNKHVATKDYVDSGMIQIGMEITWAKNATLPTGYLQCNGANFSRTTYPMLGSMYATAGRSTVYVSGDPQIALPNRTAPDSFSVIIVRAK